MTFVLRHFSSLYFGTPNSSLALVTFNQLLSVILRAGGFVGVTPSRRPYACD